MVHITPGLDSGGRVAQPPKLHASDHDPLGGADPFIPSAPGATQQSRYVGATVSGAPTSGTFEVRDFVVDGLGQIWICTTAGTPGTWQNAGSGLELGYAENPGAPGDQTIGTSVVDVTGVSITFVAPSRPVLLRGWVYSIQNGAGGVGTGAIYITDSSNVIQRQASAGTVAAGEFTPAISLPWRTSSLTAGQSYTFKLRVVAGQANSLLKLGAAYAAHLQAVTV